MIEVAIKAGKEAGEILKQNFDKVQKVTLKEDKSFQTEVDSLSEEKIISILKEKFPDHSIIAEEGGLSEKSSEYTWIIDPLDGTTNYARKFPFYCVSIALAKNDQVELGVVYDPVHEILFTAQKGQGAYMNSALVRVSEQEDLKESIVGYSRSQKKKEEFAAVYPRLEMATRTPKILGSLALNLCYVATGSLDASVAFYANSWDDAAGALLVKEAGGRVTDLVGKDWNLESKDIVASNGKIHDHLITIINIP